MAFHLPIPYHIPNPNKHQNHLLNKFGIKLIDANTNNDYLKYELPLGWEL